MKNKALQRMMFSVGSPVNIVDRTIEFSDVERCKLRVYHHKKEESMQAKEVHTTELMEYISKCANRIGVSLNAKEQENLSISIGEILINAEEHSTTKCRCSVGYFTSSTTDDTNRELNLVIMNFGDSIYKTFKKLDSNKISIVQSMEALSKKYSISKYFSSNLDEESLWTLYSLQEGVSSVPKEKYPLRGNGSIQFIESFFKLKELSQATDDSYLRIVSGRTQIVIDGQYKIITKKNSENETFKIITFNKSGSLEDRPDNKKVFKNKNYLPGTIIQMRLNL